MKFRIVFWDVLPCIIIVDSGDIRKHPQKVQVGAFLEASSLKFTEYVLLKRLSHDQDILKSRIL
jgi:hypothetical protein